jgi:hypothetical protein
MGIALALAEAGADVGVTALSEANAARVAGLVAATGRRGLGWAAAPCSRNGRRNEALTAP